MSEIVDIRFCYAEIVFKIAVVPYVPYKSAFIGINARCLRKKRGLFAVYERPGRPRIPVRHRSAVNWLDQVALLCHFAYGTSQL